MSVDRTERRVLSPAGAAALVAGVRRYADTDPERAGILEHQLLADVAFTVAQGAPRSRETALVALEVLEVDYPRWHA